jgi:hypothetical protein
MDLPRELTDEKVANSIIKNKSCQEHQVLLS